VPADDGKLEKTLLKPETKKQEETKPPEAPAVEEKKEEPKAEEPAPAEKKAEEPPPAAEEPKAEEPMPEEKKPEPTFVIEFSGGEKTFSSKPLGFTYSDKMPASVKKVTDGGAAKEMGVQPTWTILKIAGEDVTGKDFMYIKALLEKGANDLPNKA